MRSLSCLGALLAAMVGLVACGVGDVAQIGGDPARGKVALQHHACTSCHVIPGVVGATGAVGPPLDGIAKRKYLAGILPNTPENMIKWIRTPQAIAPHSAMPDLHVSEEDARDIAAYLYTLD